MKIKRLREEKGWNVSEMAGKVGCSKRTVDSVEAGKCCFIFTLSNFAEALGLAAKDILEGKEPEPPPARRSVQVQLTIRIPFEEFDQSDQLVSFIELAKYVLKTSQPINVINVADGSTVIGLEFDEYDYHRLREGLDLMFASGPGLPNKMAAAADPVEEPFWDTLLDIQFPEFRWKLSKYSAFVRMRHLKGKLSHSEDSPTSE